MTELRDFENELRATLADVVAAADEPSGLADRLVTGASRRRPPHRVQVWLGKRWVPPALTAAAVAVVVLVTVATVNAVGADRPEPPARPTPTPLPTTGSTTPTPETTTAATTAAPTTAASSPSSPPKTPITSPVTTPVTSSATSTAPATTPTSSPSGTTNQPPPALSGRWTDSSLVISPQSLGAVTRGMSLAQAQTAAGTSLSSPGDGIYRPTDHTIGGSTVLQFSWGATCFDASRSAGGAGTAVATAAGVGLGDPMSQIAVTYGSAAKPFTADPSWTGAGNIPAGILVQSGNGVLLFVGSSSDHRGGNITSIRGGEDSFHASSVFC